MGARRRLGMRVLALPTAAVVVACWLASTAVALPEGRVYEMVSPVYKAGYGATAVVGVAPDGERVAFASHGVFAGSPFASEGEAYYLARRTPTGWVTSSLSTPAPGFFVALSGGLDYVLGETKVSSSKFGDAKAAIEFLSYETARPDIPGNWGLAGGEPLPPVVEDAPLISGESRDLCHIVLGSSNGIPPLLPEALEAGQGGAELFDFATSPAFGCQRDRSRPLSIISVKNVDGPHGEPEPIDRQCKQYLGNEVGEPQHGFFNDVAAGGNAIFFTGSFGASCGDEQLFVRLGGERTLEVSKPLSEAGACAQQIPCPGASARGGGLFAGASEDGSRVFFTTQAQLAGGDEDTGRDLYMANLGCPEGQPSCGIAEREITDLVQVSHDPTTGEAADLQGVVSVAADGSRVYFIAHGVLSPEANREGESAAPGADNLYLYERNDAHPDGRTAFVGRLCSAAAVSGSAEDRRCSTTLDSVGRNDTALFGDAQEAFTTPDGRFLVFSTYARLVKSDVDAAKDVYRYDAQTGVLQRISLGEGGHDVNGNDDAFDASLPIDGGLGYTDSLRSRVIGDDGSRVVFSSAAPLSSAAVNGLVNVYEWNADAGGAEGAVSLISSGASVTPDSAVGVSPSGRDVFVLTEAQLVAQDVEEDVDLYDARLGGGFAPVEVERQPCSGDACQGPLTNPAPLLIPGSVPQAAGENAVVGRPKASGKAKPKGRKHKHRRRRLSGHRRKTARRAVRARSRREG